MTSGKLLKKYFWFLRAFQSGPITKEEIERRWVKSNLCEKGSGKHIPKSTFYHMKNEIEDLFSVDIACNDDGAFYIKDSFNGKDEFHMWILSSLAVDSTVEECEGMRGRVMYEKVPGGTQFLQPMIDAMQSCNRVIFRYGSFKHEPHEMIFAPYAIRMYKQRWYVIGESSDHPGETRVYAFDRIMQLSTTNSPFQLPKKFNVDKFFADVYGVSVGEASDVQDIVIRVQKNGVPYLRTLPLHSSQKEINTTEQYSDFQFHLAPNFEFCQEMFSRANEVEILSPQSLRDKFADTFAKLNAKYNG